MTSNQVALTPLTPEARALIAKCPPSLSRKRSLSRSLLSESSSARKCLPDQFPRETVPSSQQMKRTQPDFQSTLFQVPEPYLQPQGSTPLPDTTPSSPARYARSSSKLCVLRRQSLFEYSGAESVQRVQHRRLELAGAGGASEDCAESEAFNLKRLCDHFPRQSCQSIKGMAHWLNLVNFFKRANRNADELSTSETPARPAWAILCLTSSISNRSSLSSSSTVIMRTKMHD